MPAVDHAGSKHSRWTVVSLATPKGTANPKWRCVCECGREKVVAINNILSGKSRSCGCLQKEWIAANVVKHGMSNTPIYRSWVAMKDRCLNPNDQDFRHYGGRGIKVCERWLESFSNFNEDMGPTWQKGLSIDRTDNNGNYEPSNCRWATQKQQVRNRRDNVMVDSPWGRITAAESAERIGISVSVFMARVRQNWPSHVLFSTERYTRWNRPK